MQRDGNTGLILFENQRSRLQAISYRMLGTVSDAEDAVQDTWLKWQQADQDTIKDAEGWLVTTCTRHCIDILRGAQQKRVDYTGTWLPEPVVAEHPPSPHDQVELASSVTTAFLIMLERLSPVERAAWLLREVFAYDYQDIAFALDKSEPACRKLVSRAGKNLAQRMDINNPAPSPDLPLVQGFMQALSSGNTSQIERLLARDAELWSDGGGKVIATRRVIQTADRIARFLHGVYRKNWKNLDMVHVFVNGTPGLLLRHERTTIACLSLALDDTGAIAAIYIMRNPDKLANIRL